MDSSGLGPIRVYQRNDASVDSCGLGWTRCGLESTSANPISIGQATEIFVSIVDSSGLGPIRVYQRNDAKWTPHPVKPL